MTLHTWLAINAFFALLFGVMLVFWPRQMMQQSGVKLDKVSLIFARGVGGAILGFALINWAARNYTDLGIVWAIVGANISLHLVGGLADLKATREKTYTNTNAGWFSVIFHFVIVAVFGYYLLFVR